MLQNFLTYSQSPVVSAPTTSLSKLSIYESAACNTPLVRVAYLPEPSENLDEKTTNLKSLLEESLMQESLGLPDKKGEQRPESAIERCIEPTTGLVVEGKTMQLQVGALTSPLSKKKLESAVFGE